MRKRNICFHAFGQCFHLLLDIALQKAENMLKSYVSKLHTNENRFDKLLLVGFLLLLLFRQIIEKLCILFVSNHSASNLRCCMTAPDKGSRL